MFCLIYFYPNEVLIEDRNLAKPIPLCPGLTDSNSRPLDANEKAELIRFLANNDRYVNYYKTITDQPCFDQELQNLYYLIDPSWNEIEDI